MPATFAENEQTYYRRRGDLLKQLPTGNAILVCSDRVYSHPNYQAIVDLSWTEQCKGENCFVASLGCEERRPGYTNVKFRTSVCYSAWIHFYLLQLACPPIFTQALFAWAWHQGDHGVPYTGFLF